ncbi:unnamed protein product [Didymodactylos carnosus]|uniref:UBX domain-containing protein n=1 Tax=Didymodactylos carnosus TaxID=1234261 RepID=A0A813UFP8_9BILA|nr:unnamed protein product [Didymodactylos carnosus]CAF0870458.1 unnamed protein product [Didymodactylos carnosus]CAF3609341.1 unnamed protein product [Didymodactylos carnosus]CAF3655283.1 unnamed protein product [Didymodactylos carnosus]
MLTRPRRSAGLLTLHLYISKRQVVLYFLKNTSNIHHPSAYHNDSNGHDITLPNHEVENDASTNLNDSLGSRLSPFSKLPLIGSTNYRRLNHRLSLFETNEHSSSSFSSTSLPRPPDGRRSSMTNEQRNPRTKFIVKNQTTLSLSSDIQLAIRLPDGERLEKTFRSTDRITDVLKYVASKGNNLDKQNVYLSSGEVPKREFKDLNMTLAQAGIETRTVLFLDRS